MFPLSLVCALILALSVVAEPPRRFNSRFSRQFERLEGDSAPYPPSGWRPSGAQFNLPEPQSSYGPPSQEYGPPEVTTTIEPEVTTTELPTTTESVDADTEDVGSGNNAGPNEALTNGDRGFYYVYHPSGLLQKVHFDTTDDASKMEFSARLRYENVEPISGPIYTYDPLTYTLQRL
ncbi:unnamed protein product [Phaedon cochleariae]|uniref:DUF4794 domain-containing protein n=1 Tax=Phaedon cochleariae TaxID=80249 RepID=A0A9P0DSI3_PHACE|nr:unnamed protein product [Phaedon cochleariae]